MDKKASQTVSVVDARHGAIGANRRLPRYFSALPTYLGGKRRLAGLIFAALAEVLPPAAWRGAVLADAFSGGGAVALAAKARGFRVLANDRATRAWCVARALIENDHVRLTDIDVANLLTTPTYDYPKVATQDLVPKVLRLNEADLVDRMLAQARLMDEPKRSLAIVVILKLILRLHPMSAPTATDAIHANLEDFDRISNARLGHYVRARSYVHPRYIRALAEEVNGGVFAGRGEAHQGDALEFTSSIAADVAYLDPPYPGTSGYEREYAPIDLLLQNEALTPSAFSTPAPPLIEIIDSCAHIPIVIVSYGNAVLSVDQVRNAVSAGGREIVSVLEVPYPHLRSIASRQKNSSNKEVIVVAKRL